MGWDAIAAALVVAAAAASLLVRLRKPSCGRCPAAAPSLSTARGDAGKSPGSTCGCSKVPLQRLRLAQPPAPSVAQAVARPSASGPRATADSLASPTAASPRA